MRTDSLTWNPRATLVFSLGGAGTSDIVKLIGNFTKGGDDAFAFTFDDAGCEIGEPYTLLVFGATDFDEGDFRFTNSGGFVGPSRSTSAPSSLPW